MVRTTHFVTSVLVTILSNAQEANIWYFGDQAGIDFNVTPPVPLLDGQLTAYEGCATIADGNGDLVLYCNGGPLWSTPPWNVGAVWDRTHTIMPNGDLSTAGGCNSAAQACLIAQDPGDPERYYIFTTDCQEHAMAGGLRYNVVDMTLNGGNGDVVSSGTLLQPNINESIVGIRHANGQDVWILVHDNGSSTFFAFLLSGSGITGPVASAVGPSVGQQAGQLAANITGSKVHYAGTWTSTLFDFDPGTGVLTNPVDLQREVFGCAFARGCRLLYTCELVGAQRIFQYDLFAADVAASEQVVGTGSALMQGNLQLGPDGRIYLAQFGSTHLGVIQQPDVLGIAAGFISNGFHLGGRESEGGLPNFVNDLLGPCNQGPTAVAPAAALPQERFDLVGDHLILHSAVTDGRYEVLRADGTLVRQGPLHGDRTDVDLTGVASGVHALRTVAANGTEARATFFLP